MIESTSGSTYTIIYQSTCAETDLGTINLVHVYPGYSARLHDGF